MKHLFNIILGMAALLCLSHCTKDEEVMTGTIAGMVTDMTNANTAIAGATVTLSPTGLSQTTGSDGRYEFTEIEPGNYAVSVKANNYQEDSKSVSVYAGQSATADFQLSPGRTDVEISPLTLNFGPSNDQLSFTIKNKGNSPLQYSISGYPAYLTVSPTSAQVGAKGTQTVMVKVNRTSLTSDVSTQLAVNVGNDSYPVSITVNSQDLGAKMSVTPSTLNFGTEYSELQFTVKNVGTGGTLDWNISAPTNSCLSVSPKSGSLAIGASQPVTVKLDRTQMTADIPAAFINVNTDGGSLPVTITATHAPGGSGDEGGGSDGGDLAVAQGLYVYYKFDGDFNDATENAVNGFGLNNPTFVEGVAAGSQAVKFSRTEQSAFVVPQPIIDSREMTICFWGKDFNDGGIFYMVSSHTSRPNMFTLSMSGGALKFIVTRYNNVYNYSTTGSFMHPTLNDGQWHHIALTSDFHKTTYSTITTNLYVDGQAVDVITEGANIFTEGETSDNSYGSGTKFVMGGEIDLYNQTLNGTNMSVDNFRVYDTRKLSAKEIKQIYEAEKQ